MSVLHPDNPSTSFGRARFAHFQTADFNASRVPEPAGWLLEPEPGSADDLTLVDGLLGECALHRPLNVALLRSGRAGREFGVRE